MARNSSLLLEEGWTRHQKDMAEGILVWSGRGGQKLLHIFDQPSSKRRGL
jgi:hypothetical protein